MGGVGSNPFLIVVAGVTALVAIIHSPLKDIFVLPKIVGSTGFFDKKNDRDANPPLAERSLSMN
jgi:hypothetical protein